jgi:gamma-glutamyltranspeptidase / glutathione hydrolase
MRGAVAAGHPRTAEVGARILEQGGNAVDACVAAGFASWVTESPLTGPGGGGFMLVHTARDRRTRVLDFFVAVPSGPLAEPEAVTVIFEGTQTQVFRIGPETCAVPGTTAGLESAHRAYGSLPWAELVRPAVELADGGLEVTERQAFLHRILAPMLAATPTSGLETGDHLAWPDLARTLERIAASGAAAIYAGDVAKRIVRTVPAITAADLKGYRVIRRRPLRAPYCGAEYISNPPPSSGGVLIAYGLRQLEDPGRSGSPAAIALLARVMEDQTRVRARKLTRALGEVGGTTHISVLDAAGNAAALSVSTGSGSNVVVPGTGIHMNNMLGEFDIAGALPNPGERMTSMMAPSLVLEDGRPRLVVGSAGSSRLRGAVMQIVVNVLGHGLDVANAIAAPRVHLEGDVLHLEPPLEVGRVPYEVAHWNERNLFFGGVSAVEQLPDGTLGAAGDPRRGGAGLVVSS